VRNLEFGVVILGHNCVALLCIKSLIISSIESKRDLKTTCFINMLLFLVCCFFLLNVTFLPCSPYLNQI
jgi:hypothetical protein